jgi:hypothetical protein
MRLDGSLEGLEKAADPVSHEPGAVQSAHSNFKEEREELERVLGDPEISRSASLVRFLSFICNKYFDGQADEIREYTIAVEALGRKESSFDSHIDPIVRVTARALRKKLWNLYQNGGQNHPLQIVLPLGHYVPEFVRPHSPGAHLPIPPDESSLDAAEGENPAGGLDWLLLSFRPFFLQDICLAGARRDRRSRLRNRSSGANRRGATNSTVRRSSCRMHPNGTSTRAVRLCGATTSWKRTARLAAQTRRSAIRTVPTRSRTERGTWCCARSEIPTDRGPRRG